MDRINIFHTKKHIKIYINELLHLQVYKKQLVGVKSFIDVLQPKHRDANFGNSRFVIEFVTKNKNNIRCEYAKKELWTEILKTLDKHL